MLKSTSIKVPEMNSGSAHDYPLTIRDAYIVLGMAMRGDTDREIATFFGVAQRLIAEVKAGKFKMAVPAPLRELPPRVNANLVARG